jgi:hypothetical protein
MYKIRRCEDCRRMRSESRTWQGRSQLKVGLARRSTWLAWKVPLLTCKLPAGRVPHACSRCQQCSRPPIAVRTVTGGNHCHIMQVSHSATREYTLGYPGVIKSLTDCFRNPAYQKIPEDARLRFQTSCASSTQFTTIKFLSSLTFNICIRPLRIPRHNLVPTYSNTAPLSVVKDGPQFPPFRNGPGSFDVHPQPVSRRRSCQHGCSGPVYLCRLAAPFPKRVCEKPTGNLASRPAGHQTTRPISDSTLPSSRSVNCPDSRTRPHGAHHTHSRSQETTDLPCLFTSVATLDRKGGRGQRGHDSFGVSLLFGSPLSKPILGGFDR